MVIKPRQNWDVSRRALLKGLGLGAAMLPALRTSKAWGQNGQGGVQQRLILVLASEGYIINQWKPRAGSLMDQTLPPSSSPLEPYKSYVNFLHPLTNPSYRGAISGHQAYATIFWGGPNGGGQYPEPTGPTLDQVVAGALKPAQRKSLNFQVQVYRQPESGGRGAKHCHYTGPGQAIVPELNPFKTYQTLFAGMPAPTANGMPDPAVQRLFARRKSVLDYVAGNLTGFRGKVAAEDGKLIDQHLTSIRALEGELTGIATGNGPRATVAAPANMSDADILGGPMANKIYPDIMHAYMDMQHSVQESREVVYRRDISVERKVARSERDGLLGRAEQQLDQSRQRALSVDGRRAGQAVERIVVPGGFVGIVRLPEQLGKSEQLLGPPCRPGRLLVAARIEQHGLRRRVVALALVIVVNPGRGFEVFGVRGDCRSRPVEIDPQLPRPPKRIKIPRHQLGRPKWLERLFVETDLFLLGSALAGQRRARLHWEDGVPRKRLFVAREQILRLTRTVALHQKIKEP
jgi:hypothetical protein